MKVLFRTEMPDKTPLNLEEWYSGSLFTVGAYPIAKHNIPGQFTPKAGTVFRCEFDFKDAAEALRAFRDLEGGNKELLDFKDFLYNPALLVALTK